MKSSIHTLFFVLIIACTSKGLGDSHHYNSNGKWSASRPDGHAPIGVMGDHTHNEGESMLSYRYMRMNMQGNRNGTRNVSTADVLSEFMVAPTEMDMEMHMIGAMFAPRDWLTVMAMVPIVEVSMDHVTRMGTNFSTRASGLGDISVSGLWRVYDDRNQRIHINTGVSLPSGEIDETDTTPAGPDSQLPYPMQLGSGTTDLLPGITYLGQSDNFSWGAQAMGNVRLGRNDNDYSLGDVFTGTFWGAYNINDLTSFSLRNQYINRGNIDGADPLLNPMVVQTADPNRQGGATYNFGFGLNLLIPDGMFQGLRLAAEYVVPVYEDLDGPQLETDALWIFGAQFSF